jgi:hypothetical protein
VPVCWCCGNQFDERDLLPLGTRPEVGVCFGCARYLRRRAVEREDERRVTVAVRVRSGVRGALDWVVRGGWHRRPVVGRVLRRIDRHLP